MTPLLVGSLLVVLALAFVLWPLVRGAATGASTPREPGAAPASTVGEYDAAEEMIARARTRMLSCPDCGPRSEEDAWFCSDCGRFLGTVCMSCGAQVGSERGRSCSVCGGSLAA
jgi:hypothetical protein